MKKFLFVSFIALLFVSCSSGSNSKSAKWPDTEQQSFTEECVKGASSAMGEDVAKTYCDCMLNKIMVKYPKSEDVGQINMDEMTTMAQDCI